MHDYKHDKCQKKPYRSLKRHTKNQLKLLELTHISHLRKIVLALIPVFILSACAGGSDGDGSDDGSGSGPIVVTPTPIATPEPSPPTVTPEPSVTPEPTVVPEPSAAPEPTPEPTVTPEPTATPEPSAAPEPSPTPEPSAAPEPTPTPEPSAAPEPTPTPEPTETPSPTPDPALVALYERGADVYNGACAACHGPLETTLKRERTQADIENAIVAIGPMRTIQLSTDDLEALVYALNNPNPADVIDEPSPVELSGAELYEQQCSDCHGDSPGESIPLFVNYTDLTGIENHISIAMPPSDPTTCIDDCAEKIAAYLITLIPITEPGEATPAVTQRLKRSHYYKTLEFLVAPFEVDTSALSHPIDPVNDGFLIGNHVDSTLIYAYNTNASYLAKTIVERVESDSQIIECAELTQSCAENFYRAFAEKAYRRPLSDEQTDRIDQLFSSAEGDILLGLGNVLGFIFQSPSLLYYVNPVDDDSDYTLANQLSYLLWNEPPDEELLLLADQNALRDANTFSDQVDRLLDDEKGLQGMYDFVDQWLSIEDVSQIVKDTNQIPNFSDAVVQTMYQNITNYVSRRLANERSFESIFSSTYNLSSRLETALLEFSDDVQTSRQGILSHPGLLAALAGPTERSPIQRGAYVMETLLCDERTPPANVDEVVDSIVVPEDASIRERTELLTDSPVCMSCHESINSAGFGFENYDGLGLPISENTLESIVIPGTDSAEEITLSFNGVESLQQQLLASHQFFDCASDKALAYANTVDYPNAENRQAIHTSFRESADLKALFKSIAMTLIEN